MRFLILTQLEHEFIIVRMLRAGASGYMLKTINATELKEAIKTILKQSFYFNKLVTGVRASRAKKGLEEKDIKLSEQEEAFLKWCCTDLSYKEIADKMGVNESAVIYYRKQLFQRLGVQSRTGLALCAFVMGLVPLDEMQRALLPPTEDAQ